LFSNPIFADISSPSVDELFFDSREKKWMLYSKVVKVPNGDGNVWLLDKNKKLHKIRITKIDTPEFAQSFRQKSKRGSLKLKAGQEIKVYCYKIDKYKPVVHLGHHNF